MDERITIVEGEFITRLNGLDSSVIIQIICKNQEDAIEVKESRKDSYKNLQIKQTTRNKLLNRKNK